MAPTYEKSCWIIVGRPQRVAHLAMRSPFAVVGKLPRLPPENQLTPFISSSNRYGDEMKRITQDDVNISFA